jgi:hypothetical protein
MSAWSDQTTTAAARQKHQSDRLLGAERRANPRERITTQGLIWRDEPYSIVICSLRDMSPAGAGLLLPDSVSPLPTEFALTFDRVTRRCAVVWRHLGRIGLKFESI